MAVQDNALAVVRLHLFWSAERRMETLQRKEEDGREAANGRTVEITVIDILVTRGDVMQWHPLHGSVFGRKGQCLKV